MEDQNFYACFLVHGAPIYVSFEEEGAYRAFRSREQSALRNDLYRLRGPDGKWFWLRPSAVDAIFEDVKPSV